MVNNDNRDFTHVFIKLGEKIKSERLKKNLRQIDLAVLSGVNESYISQIENATRKKSSLYIYLEILYALEIDPKIFFSDLEDVEPFSEIEFD